MNSSTGGPAALMQILGSFVEAPPVSVVICQHMPQGFTRGFAERIDRMTAFAAREAQDGDAPAPGTVLVAPGGAHLEFERRGPRTVARISPGAPSDRYAPAVDRVFTSAAKHWGADVLAIVLTGMGDDGREGVRAVKQAGGRVVATLGTLATDVGAILATLENLGQVWPDGAAEKPLWKVVDERGQRLGVFADEKVADGFAKGWIFQQGQSGLTNTDFGHHATVTELTAEDRAELTRAPEREPEVLMERTP